jgi:elongator complex protein 1
VLFVSFSYPAINTSFSVACSVTRLLCDRVDLNLLVDYAWPRFTQAADAFVAAVPGASDLGDLLLALRSSSTLQPGGTYASLSQMLGWQQQQQQSQPPAAAAVADGGDAGGDSGKVSGVCAALRAAVLRLPGRFVPLGHLKTVVMSYAR